MAQAGELRSLLPCPQTEWADLAQEGTLHPQVIFIKLIKSKAGQKGGLLRQGKRSNFGRFFHIFPHFYYLNGMWRSARTSAARWRAGRHGAEARISVSDLVHMNHEKVPMQIHVYTLYITLFNNIYIYMYTLYTYIMYIFGISKPSGE